MMKQLTLSLLAVIALTFTACKSTDESCDAACQKANAPTASEATVNAEESLQEAGENGTMTPGGVQMMENEVTGGY